MSLNLIIILYYILGSPVDVFVDLHVESFGNIEEASMEFKVYSYFKQTWYDKRLAGKINRTVNFKAADIRNVWTPDAYCYNARITNLMLPSSETHSKISLSPEGELVYSRGITFTASCFMDLHSFPHDRQSCYLKFGSYAYDDSAVILKWSGQDLQVSHDDMAQYAFLGGKFSSELESFSGVNYTTIIVTFSFQRRLGFYLLQVYVPDILIVLLSWIVFWLVPDDPGARLTIGVTTVLTIMFLCGAVNVSLPPVSYAKAMDWYLMVSFAFVFLSVIESLVVFLLSTKPLGKTSKTKETNSHSLESKILSSLKARQGTFRKSATNKGTDVEGHLLEMNIVVKDRTLPMSLEDIRITGERQCYEAVMRRNKKIAHRIDRISRILFPIAFASYTLGYWLSYS
ncbi:unnamed protein product [Porites lobata]|uniref:Uncharacterized protein n=1 Tax=Porites lobata TaxID=104759 RepID=A0ABN8RTK5_9CNID|nr:unnamed protein product [Porites lobata]